MSQRNIAQQTFPPPPIDLNASDEVIVHETTVVLDGSTRLPVTDVLDGEQRTTGRRIIEGGFRV